MTITDSARGPKTCLDVFPVIPGPFTHPGNTQKQFLPYLITCPTVPYYDLVRGWWTKKNIGLCCVKKTLLYISSGADDVVCHMIPHIRIWGEREREREKRERKGGGGEGEREER